MSFSLVFILCFLSLIWKRSFNVPFFIPSFANFMHISFLLVSKESRLIRIRAILYFSFRTSFAKVFCVLSRSSIFYRVSDFFIFTMFQMASNTSSLMIESLYGKTNCKSIFILLSNLKCMKLLPIVICFQMSFITWEWILKRLIVTPFL